MNQEIGRYLAPIVAVLLLVSCGKGTAIPTAAAAAAKPPGQQASLPGPAGTPVSANIVVDQFGYRTASRKVAVLRDPRVGFDSGSRFPAGTAYQVRRAEDGSVAFAGKPLPWRDGAIDAASGDAGWWFDFSALEKEGTYYILDEQRNVRSPVFRIAPQIYSPILKAAVRTFFYQRSGFAKRSPWADACWVDDAAYVGPGQDRQARDILDRDNAARARDVSGGWFDAGDTNKYVTFATTPVHQLLTSYQTSPSVFTDNFGIPESANGIPDLLDEVKWEVDWLKRMQNPDGSVALKVGTLEYTSGTRPGLDRRARYYIPACTSATIAAAGMFAHAALAFGSIDRLSGESADLRARAQRAWKQFLASPRQVACDNGEIKAGDADVGEMDQNAEAVVAAIYLFALTGAREYEDHIKANYRGTRPFNDIGWSRYGAHQGEALLFYARLPGADRETASAIVAAKLADVAAGNQIYGVRPQDDLYAAFLHDAQYHWGSNQVRANYGNTNLDAARLVPSDRAAPFRERAEATLHYFHGVNPFGMVYLTNMDGYGATRSANEVFHAWFWHETPWDSAATSRCGPVPGFVPGGPNAKAAADGVPATLSPPAGQPPQKSYKDWNTPWPDSSWAISEPAIYYQAAYIRLLAEFAD